jgi:serine/threonine-protein kinase
MGRSQALSGATLEARKTLDELLNEEPVQPYAVAAVHLGLGEKDAAIEWLERAYDENSYFLIGINADPGWDPLRDNPRFRALVRRMGLEPQEPPN